MGKIQCAQDVYDRLAGERFWRLAPHWQTDILHLVPENASDTEPCPLALSMAHLKLLHPQLPVVLHYLLVKKDGAQITPYIVNAQIGLLLDFWNRSPVCSLPKEAIFHEFIEPSPLSVEKLLDVTLLPGKDNPLVQLTHHYIETTPAGMAFSLSSAKSTVELRAGWLDQHCAGWRDRLLVGNSLGLEQHVVASHCLQLELLSPTTDHPHVVPPTVVLPNEALDVDRSS